MRPPESHYRRSTGPAANGCGSFHAASTRRVAVWLLIALSGFWLLTAVQTTYANPAADANPQVILQQAGCLPATAIPGHTSPRLAGCGYFLEHQHCPQATAALVYGRKDLPGAAAPASVAWNTAFFPDAPYAKHARPPQFFSARLYLRTSRLLI